MMAEHGGDSDGVVFYRFLRAIERIRFPTRVERDAYDRLRNAVAGLRSLGAKTSMEQEASVALVQRAEALEAEFNSGQPFPIVDGDLPRGRRAGTKDAYDGQWSVGRRGNQQDPED